MNEKRAPLYAQIAEMRKLYDIARQDLAAAQAENEKLREALTVACKYLAVVQHSSNTLHEYRSEIQSFLGEIAALSPPPLAPEKP